MQRVFNTTGSCNPERHYMVNIDDKLAKIKVLVDSGAYFTINRARQYGKTTTLAALRERLLDEYCVISLDFQRLGNEEFETEHIFSLAFLSYLSDWVNNQWNTIDGIDSEMIAAEAEDAGKNDGFNLSDLFFSFQKICETAQKPVVLMIDEADSASNNQVFLDFLKLLRAYYLDRDDRSIFHSVIFAGVHDMRYIRRKPRLEEEYDAHIPWNIAADFDVDMSLSKDGIEGMLKEYEADHHTGMDTGMMAGLIYDATSGYPFLVSRLCKLIDEQVAGSGAASDKASAWTREGYLEAEKMLVSENNTLFKSMIEEVREHPELIKILKISLFEGMDVSYNIYHYNENIEIGAVLGLIKNERNRARISNRIFETVLTDYFLLEEMLGNEVYSSALVEKNRFIQGGRLNMRLVLERFVAAFTELYKDEEDRFKEEIGRKYFLLFLKPIINGTGHYYVEARTRDMRRTDVVVDYAGEQFVVELKIWRGTQYYEDGEEQTAEYLDCYGLKTGYMVIFNFTKNKEIGVVEKQYGEKLLIEATV